MYHIVFRRQAEKQLRKLATEQQKHVTEAIDSLRSNPFQGKKLAGEYDGFWGMRVWPYRIIYLIEKKKILIIIVRIGHRQGVYK